MARAQECYVLFFALPLKPSQPVIYGTVPEICEGRDLFLFRIRQLTA
jgi:hypothetical protein